MGRWSCDVTNLYLEVLDVGTIVSKDRFVLSLRLVTFIHVKSFYHKRERNIYYLKFELLVECNRAVCKCEI